MEVSWNISFPKPSVIFRLKEEFNEDDTTVPFNLEELKIHDSKEYNIQMKQKKAPKSRDELDIERELKALEKELEDL